MDDTTEPKNMANRNFDELKFEFLSDRQLIHIIRQAQQELDTRYPFKLLHNLKCPACGQTEHDFWIGCRFIAILNGEDAYIPTDTENKPSWGPEDGCTCSECTYSGLVIDFLQSGKED